MIFAPKKVLTTFTFFYFTFIAFAQNDENIYNQLLEYRLDHSDSYRLIQNETKIVENNYARQVLNSYMQLNLGSGGISLNFTDAGVDFSMAPTTSVSLPSFSNLNLGVSFPISKNGNTTNTDFRLTFSVDIYSQEIQSQKLQRQSALRQKEEALAKVAQLTDTIRAELLNDIKSILNSYLDYLTKQLSQVETNIDFRRLQIEGYGSTSIRYKAAELKNLSAQRQAETAKKLFLTQVKKFLRNGGIEEAAFGKDDDEILENSSEFFKNLCLSIPEEAVIALDNIDLAHYRDYIKAEQSYQDTLAQREIQNSLFKLSANAGLSLPISSTSTKPKTLSTGLDFSFPGGNLSAGVNLNFDDIKKPGLNFSIMINPLDIYYKVLSSENEGLQKEIDAINFQATTEKYESAVFDIRSRAENISVANEAALYEYEIYTQNAKDVSRLYRNGIVSQLDNEQASLQEMQALIRYAQSKADISIFNIDTSNSFLAIEAIE